MKAFIALTVANEIDGRNTVVRADKASVVRENIENWLRMQQQTWRETIHSGTPPQPGLNVGLQQPVTVMDCLCQRNIIEVEIEGI